MPAPFPARLAARDRSLLLRALTLLGASAVSLVTAAQGTALAAAAADIPTAPLPLPGAGALGDGGRAAPGNRFSDAALWDDGLAEVCEYDLVQSRYGELHPGGSVVTIIVREHLDPALAVKALRADQPGAIPVLKCHLVRSFPTGVYRYEQSSTVYMRRSDAVPLRLFITSHEWCGAAMKTFVNLGAGSQLRTLSYFDGVGEQMQELDLGVRSGAAPAVLHTAVLHDQLWVWNRTLLARGATQAEIPVVPDQLGSRPASVTATPMEFAITLAQPTVVPAGIFAAVTLALDDAERIKSAPHTFTYERAFPHRLLSVRWRDGSTWTLRRTARFDYWNQHHRGGAWPK